MMGKLIKMMVGVGIIIGTYKLLHAPYELVSKKEGEVKLSWIEGQRGWDENGTNLWTSVNPLPLYNVGIGTQTPSYKLHVVGDILATGSLRLGSGAWPITVTSTPTIGYVLKWNGSAFVPQSDEVGSNYWTLSGSNLYPNNTTWNVGIGTTTPAYKLDVAGTSRIQGDVYINSWPISVTSTPTTGYVLKWNGSAFVPQPDQTGAGEWVDAGSYLYPADQSAGEVRVYEDATNHKIYAIQTNSSYAAVFGRYSTTNMYGYLGLSAWGVYGNSDNTSGAGVGGFGGTTTTGVYGQTNTSAAEAGVIGFNQNASGTGIIGTGSNVTAIGWSGNGDGIVGASDAYGVVGSHYNGSNVNRWGALGTSYYGVYGSTDNTSGAGVGGWYTGGAADVPGVYGYSTPADYWGYGGYFVGGYRGVCGVVSPTGSNYYYGVYGYVSGGSGYNYGVYGYGTGSSNYNYGVFGVAGSTTSYGVGVFGGHLNSSGTGIAGAGNGLSTYYTLTSGSGGAFTGTGLGVFGISTGASASPSGGYFASDPNQTSYVYVGLVYSGIAYKVNGNGLVATIMETREGRKNLFAPECPEAYFIDFGEARLENGRKRIYLDPVFLDCVTINEKYPLKVFVQLKDDCNGVYVKTYKDGFEVIELRNGKSDAEFSYMVVAKWKGYEDLRFPDAPSPLNLKAAKISEDRKFEQIKKLEKLNIQEVKLQKVEKIKEEIKELEKRLKELKSEINNIKG